MPAPPSEPQPRSAELMRPRPLKHLLPFVEAGAMAGVDVDELLAPLGVTRHALRDPTTRLPYYQLQWLCEQIILRSGDPEIGLRAAERADFAKLEVFGHLIQHFVQLSPSLLSVIELLLSFWTRVCGTALATLSVSDERVVIRVLPTVAPPPEVYDGCAGACCQLIQQLGGASLRPLEVRLPRPRPAHPERFEQFFSAPVVFDSAQLELVYARAALSGRASDVEQLSADAHSRREGVLPAGVDKLAQQVYARVLAALAEGVPSLSQLARKLGVSARTLRRRLQEARTGYAELVDQARRQRALALASRAELDVTQLAQLTGFADGSAFARAFRRWTGEPPSAFMQRARGRQRAGPNQVASASRRP
jgi:AraC-like DNA-binding protein